MTQEKCGKKNCNKKIANEGAIQCEICEVWWHKECANISDAQFDLLNESPQLHWFCWLCQHGCEKLLSVVGKLQAQVMEVQRELVDTKSEVKDLKEELKKERLERMIAVDRNEMYSRKDALRINGIPPDQTESNIQLEDKVINLAEKIGVKIERQNISVAHRLKPTKKGAHPIIVKFSTRRAKDAVYNAKKNLKDVEGMSETYISEDLTRLRFRTLLQCKQCPGFQSITTRGGKIKVWKGTNTHPITVESPLDIAKLGLEPDLHFLGLVD